MQIIDAQMHEPAPWLDWMGDSAEVQHRMLTEVTAAYLDALGIQGVVLFPGPEASSAAWTSRAFPNRFSYVPNFTPEVPDIDTAIRAAKQRHSEGQVGIRALIGWPMNGTEVKRLDAGAWHPVFAACEKHEVPVFLFITGWLPRVIDIAKRFPSLVLIIDHLGLRQPPLDEADHEFKSLPDLLALAQFPNVAVKLCGLPALSAQQFPYADVIPRLRAIVDAFGANRLMWASDTTRFSGRIGLQRSQNLRTVGFYQGKHTYAESLHFIRDSSVLSNAEKKDILGGTARRLLKWPNCL